MPQRRYTEEQLRRIAESGERPPEGMSPIGRFVRNAAVAIPRGLTDLVSAAGMVVPAVQAGLSSEVDFPEAMYGKEGVEELQAYVQGEANAAFEQLPEERRTQRNYDALVDAISNSDAAEEIRLRRGPINTKMGIEAGNFLNDMVGLEPVRKETIVDDAEQIAASALVPSGLVTKPLAKLGTSAAARAVRVAADVAVPGTAKYTAPRVAANIGVPLAASQGVRALADQPSVVTGDALGPELGVDVYDPDPVDAHAGMNGEQMSAAAAVFGGMTVAAAVMLGKTNKLASKKVIEDIDGVDAAPIPPDAKLTPTLTRGQRLKSEAIDSSSPLRDTVSNAYEGANNPKLRETIADIERVTTNTANVNLNTAHRNALDLGTLPLSGTKIVPLSMVERGLAQLQPQELKLFEDGMLAKTMLDQHALQLASLSDEMRDAKLGIKTDPKAVARLKAMEAKQAAMSADDAQLVGDMSVKQAREIAAMMTANPKLAQAETMLRQFTSQVLDAKVADGQITKEQADKLRAVRPNYMPIQEDPDAGLTGMQKWWDGLRRPFQRSKEPSLYGTIRGPLLKTDAENGTNVKSPMKPMDAYKQYLYDHIQYTVMNDATRTYVKALKDTPDYGRTIRELDSMTVDEFYKTGEPEKVARKSNIFAYTDGGRIHYMEAADPEVLRALQFNAPVTVFLLNGMRKVYQHGTTGMFAPEFAPTAALFEEKIGRMTRQPGRSFGMVDATLRRAFPNSKLLSDTLDKIGGSPLPMVQTSHVQMLAGLFQQIRYSELKEAGQKIANDLETQSGVLGWIAKSSPQGRALLEVASQSMLRSFNQSRYGAFVNAGVKQSNLLDDPLRQVRDGYAGVNYRIGNAAKPVQYAFKQYMNMLEMMHNSAKYAFFAQNLAALERKYAGKVPQKEIEKLASETKSLSGDMTRSVGNPTLSKTLSAFPYAQVAVNSSYHLASAITRDPVYVGSRIITGSLMPKIAAISMVSAIPGVAEWYWDDLPTWQRFNRVPVIGPDWWTDLVDGKQRPLEPGDIYLMPEAPELTFITNPIITFLRTMGAFGNGPQETAAFGKELGEGMETITSVGTPPLVAAVASGNKIDLGRIITSPLTGKPIVEEAYNENPHQGFNNTGLNADSVFSRGFSNMMTSLFGVAVGNVINSMDVAQQAITDGDTVAAAFQKAFSYSVFQAERRLPEVPGQRESGAYLYTNGQRRMYASTARRERNREVMEAFEPVAMQLSADKDRSGANQRAEKAGLQGLRMINDPQVKKVAVYMYDVLRKGKMKSLESERSDYNKDLARIEASKERLSPTEYHMMTNAIYEKMNAINAQQEDIIQQLDASLTRQYGIDIEKSIKVIGQSLTH